MAKIGTRLSQRIVSMRIPGTSQSRQELFSTLALDSNLADSGLTSESEQKNGCTEGGTGGPTHASLSMLSPH